jgi:DNA-binding transcriptional LysR family regulator
LPVDSHASNDLAELVQTVASTHPLVNLSIQIGSTNEAVAALLQARPTSPSSSTCRSVNAYARSGLPLPFGCVVAPRHPLLAQPDVKFQDVMTHPIVLQSRSLPIRHFLELQAWLFAEPRGHVETNSLHLVKNLARSGEYVAFTSELDAATELADGTLRFLPLTEIHALPQSSDIVIDASKPINPLVQIVADCAVMMIEAALAAARNRQGDTSRTI